VPDSATDPSRLAAAKKRARNDARNVRAEAKATTGPLAGDLLQAQFLDHVPMTPNAVVAGYWPMNDEMNPVPLLKRLIKNGVQCALPAVVGKGKPLEFRAWEPDSDLEDGPFGTFHPPASAAVTSPGILLLPLLAFDASGYRLGYGGGYYDRTLEDMKSPVSTVLAVGIAYQAQQIDAVPHSALDQRLDWVVTENSTHQFF
jgi:5-formyltetrahydrofolate cyclo-ligase